jgi:hypothetical protein
VTYLPTACAALVLVQAAFPAGAQNPPAGKPRIDELVDQILKHQDTMPTPQSKPPSTPPFEPTRGTVMNPRCQPWPLPAEKYDSWRTLTFNFDSRDY